jgi:hypothetical protein
VVQAASVIEDRAASATGAVLAAAQEALTAAVLARAAAAAPRVWEASAAAVVAAEGSAAAAAVVVAAVVVAVVAVVAGADVMERRTKMKTINSNQRENCRHHAGVPHAGIRALLSMLVMVTFLGGLTLMAGLTASAQTTVARGKAFATAQEAANALIDATEKYDEAALTEILGPGSYDIIHTGEPARDAENSKAFAAQARTKMNVELNKTRNRATVIVGNEDWPLPVPIVKVGRSWYFDTKAGRQELLLRRVGRNELDAIQIARNYVEAQHEFAMMKKQGGVNQYAQKIISTDGQQDGLAWKNADGTWGGPIGEEIAQAITKGHHAGEPFHGYYFKILKGQGPAAPLGELDYVIKGVMIGGFALVASPAQYRNTGVKTFLVSQDGVVYEKDLGPKTIEQFKAMERFNPDRSWTPVKDN